MRESAPTGSRARQAPSESSRDRGAGRGCGCRPGKGARHLAPYKHYTAHFDESKAGKCNLMLDPNARRAQSSAARMTDFETHPDRYVHWKLAIEGAIARLDMAVVEDRPHRPGYRLKLNSYDLGVDIELADVVQRLRFEHPEVKVVVVSSTRSNIFCAGA